MRRLLGISTCTLALLVQAACASDSITGANQWVVSEIIPGDGGGQYLAIGDTVTLSASAREYDLAIAPGTDSRHEPARFRWSSSDPAVAQVDQYGGVRAIALGSALIQVVFTGQNGGRSASGAIQVVPPTSAVTVSLSQDTITLGDTVRVVGRALGAAGQPVTGAILQVAADNLIAGTALQASIGNQRLTVVRVEAATVPSAQGPQKLAPVTVTYRADQAGVVGIDVTRPYLRYSQLLHARANVVVLPRP